MSDSQIVEEIIKCIDMVQDMRDREGTDSDDYPSDMLDWELPHNRLLLKSILWQYFGVGEQYFSR